MPTNPTQLGKITEVTNELIFLFIEEMNSPSAVCVHIPGPKDPFKLEPYHNTLLHFYMNLKSQNKRFKNTLVATSMNV